MDFTIEVCNDVRDKKKMSHADSCFVPHLFTSHTGRSVGLLLSLNIQILAVTLAACYETSLNYR